MEREVGGGIGMGNMRKPTAVSFQCMTKSTTKKKKKGQKIIVTKGNYVLNCLTIWKTNSFEEGTCLFS